jgi:hypothetical protein
MPIVQPGYVSLRVFAWRYFTGAHLNGRRYTNATWFRRGTSPKPALTWWTALPRLHRAAYRLLIIVIPASWVYAYTVGRWWTLLATFAVLPYVLHHGSLAATRRIAPVKKVKVRMSEFDNSVIDLTGVKSDKAAGE